MDVFQNLKYTDQIPQSNFLKVMVDKTSFIYFFFAFLMSSFLLGHVKHVLASSYKIPKKAELKCVIRWMVCISMFNGEHFCTIGNTPTGFVNACYKSCQTGLQAQIYFLVSDLKLNVLVWYYVLLIHD